MTTTDPLSPRTLQREIQAAGLRAEPTPFVETNLTLMLISALPAPCANECGSPARHECVDCKLALCSACFDVIHKPKARF